MQANTRKMVTLGMLAAISILLVAIVRFPLFPAAPFLEYDPADIPIFIATFLYGPLTGFALTVVVSLIQGFTVSAASSIIGITMHIFATGSFALVAGSIYKRQKGIRSAIVALVAGILTMSLSMLAWNAIFTPIFMGVSFDYVKPLLLPVILPFNLIKGTVNSLVTLVVYKAVSRRVER